MAYFLIENFAAGVDVRKHPYTAPAGTLRIGTNCHVTPGGEIEKRPAWVTEYTVSSVPGPDGIISIEAEGNDLYVIAQDPTGAAVGTSLLTTVGDVNVYLHVIDGTGLAIARNVQGFETFAGKPYLTVGLTTGGYRHFYDGNVVAGAPSSAPYIRYHNSKMYAVGGRTIFFSAIGDPTDWSGAGSGSIDVVDESAMVAAEEYYGKLAVFGKNTIQIWAMDTDPANNTREQVLRNIGTEAPRSPGLFGDDILFLANSGVRSLRARDSSNAANISDLGSPVDDEIRAIRASLASFHWSHSKILTDQNSERLLVITRGGIWVLSAFPGPKVTAWTKYSFPPNITTGGYWYAAVAGGRYVFCPNSTGELIFLGGADGDTYDNTEAIVQLPYLNADNPAALKTWHGVDAALTGTWTIEVSQDPHNEIFQTIGTFVNSTYSLPGDAGMNLEATAISLRFRTTDNQAAVLANAGLHYVLNTTG